MTSRNELLAAMRRHREERRALLTRGERIVVTVWMAAAWVLPVGGVALLVYGSGGAHTAGIVLLGLALVIMAVPISPFLRARIRRREALETRPPG